METFNDIRTSDKINNYIQQSNNNQINKAKFDRRIRAIVQSINNDVAEISFLDSSETITNVKIKDGLNLRTNDVVLVSVINNSLSNLFIESKIINFNSLFNLDSFRNYYIIEDFSDNSNWTESGSSKNDDSVYYKIGKQGLRVIETNNVASNVSVYKTFSLDLTTYEDSEISTTEDYIFISFRIQDILSLDITTPITLKFYNSSDYFYYDFSIGDLVTGWNNKNILKSDFDESGTPNWNSIDKIELIWKSKDNYQDYYVTWAIICLVESLEKNRYLQLQLYSSSDVPNGSIFIDSSDSIIKFKDLSGNLHSLY